MYQIHFGANYLSGTYGWTTNLETIKKSVEWQLEQLKTDYIDYGFIHCIDENSDWDTYLENGVLEYIKELKQKGIVKHIGISSHTPKIVQKAIDTGIIDMVMFSINPSYDYRQGDYAIGSSKERMDLYRRCEKEGIGISVMKAFSGGQLLDGKTSPFGKKLTKFQCIQYALDKLGEFTPKDVTGNCVYCNHCKPCTNGLDIGLINKYYDLAIAGDKLAKDHYKNLDKKAEDCISCGHCNKRCPFKVNQVEKMKEIAEYFKV